MAFNSVDISDEFQSEFWLRALQKGQEVIFCGTELESVFAFMCCLSMTSACWGCSTCAAVPWLVVMRTVDSRFVDVPIKDWWTVVDTWVSTSHACKRPRNSFTQLLNAWYLSFADFDVQSFALKMELSLSILILSGIRLMRLLTGLN